MSADTAEKRGGLAGGGTDPNDAARRPPAQGGTPPDMVARLYRPLIGMLLLLIAYGSLYPFTWNFEQPNAFILQGGVGRIDLIENIVLFIPLGCVLAWHGALRRQRVMGFLGWFVALLAFASVLQWLQVYLPRTPALSDIVFNMVGHLLGWGVGLASVRFVGPLLERHQSLRGLDRFALWMLVLWLVAELFPLIPAFDVSTVWNNVKSLWLQEPWQPRRMLEHAAMTVLGLDAFGMLMRSIDARRLLRSGAVLLTLAVLCGKFIVEGQSPGVAVVAGIALGGLLWWWVDTAQSRVRAFWILGVAFGAYLVYALAPYRFQQATHGMHWIPFASSLQGGIHRVIGAVAFESLCYAGMIWAAMRLGASVHVFTVLTALLALTCEWLQQFLPGRTAEVSSVLVALAMGWLVAMFANRGLSRQPGPRVTRGLRGASRS